MSNGRQYLICAWVIGALLTFAPGAFAQTQRLGAAEFVVNDASQAPPDNAAWRSQALPDRWGANHPGVSGSIWYRLHFDSTEADAQIHAVYLPRFCMNAAVFLNGVFLGAGGSFDEPVSRNWNRPQFFLIPPGLLRAGQNTLHVRVHSPPYTQGGFSPPLVGPEQTLRPEFERAFFLHITLNQTLGLIVFAIGVLMLSLWWRRRKDTMYGYFGLSALTWSLNSANLYIQDIPLSTTQWEVLINASFQVFAALFLISLLRFIDARSRWLERLLWALLIGSPVMLALAPESAYSSLTAALHLLSLSAAAVLIALLTRAALRRRDLDIAMLAAGMWLIVLFAAHDWLLHSKLLWYANGHWLGQGDIYLLQFAAPMIFMVVGWIMTARFVRVLNDFERLNVELEDRVAAKHAELAANFDRLQTVEKERAVLEERERLMADMHDGLGGQLVTALRVMESDRAASVDVPQLLRECLDEMRLVVNSLASDHADLLAVLSDLRYRFESRLVKAGITLDWRAQDVPPLADLSPRVVLDIQRIAQEALTNVIKHAHADRITVETGVTENGAQAFVRIADNGQGLRGDHRGRGLVNMHKRAQRIGGELRVESADNGTIVTLLLPLAHAPASTGATDGANAE
jgi:signal transduction histidine kinase